MMKRLAVILVVTMMAGMCLTEAKSEEVLSTPTFDLTAPSNAPTLATPMSPEAQLEADVAVDQVIEPAGPVATPTPSAWQTDPTQPMPTMTVPLQPVPSQVMTGEVIVPGVTPPVVPRTMETPVPYHGRVYSFPFVRVVIPPPGQGGVHVDAPGVHVTAPSTRYRTIVPPTVVTPGAVIAPPTVVAPRTVGAPRRVVVPRRVYRFQNW